MGDEIVIEVINGNGVKSTSKFVHSIDLDDLEKISKEGDKTVLRFHGTTIKVPTWFCRKIKESSK